MSAVRRKRRSGELRVRSGCWKCRERRVKCPEQRPVCSHCERLGHVCQYELRLTWQKVSKSDDRGTHLSRQHYQNSINVIVERWMFLNTTLNDFDAQTTEDDSYIDDSASDSLSSLSSLSPSTHTASLNLIATPLVSSPRSLDFFSFSREHSRLWNYFTAFVAPRCALIHATNPYRNVILRIAAASLQGPLFQCIMAVSASQMQMLRHGNPQISIWDHRNRALAALRNQVVHYDSQSKIFTKADIGVEQIISSTLMMCFFEILHDCSRSWEIHADFARSFLLSGPEATSATDPDHRELLEFAVAYFLTHDILAATVWTPRHAREIKDFLHRFTSDPAIHTLTGCSKQLMAILAEITELGSTISSLGTLEPPTSPKVAPIEHPVEVKHRRDDIERRIHQLEIPFARGYVSSEGDDSHTIAETKRLAALMYLYARIDNANPFHPHMVRLTGQILNLLPSISLRTNTILWPLFIVATLGVRPESDEDRKLVLERLDALQQTRQLGNVKKARKIIEDVWKARDLKASGALMGWSILGGRHGTISLA